VGAALTLHLDDDVHFGEPLALQGEGRAAAGVRSSFSTSTMVCFTSTNVSLA